MNIKKDLFFVSNLLSLLRLVLAVPIWFLMGNMSSVSMKWAVFIVCVIAASTDFMDGYFARKLNEVTELGKIIDPLADKFVVGVIIIKLYILGIVPDYYFFMIVGRDVLIFLGGIFVSKKLGKVLPSNMLGKITVVNISIVILCFIMGVSRDNFIFLALYALSIFLIFASFIGYLFRAIEFIKQQKKYEAI
jgi:CDP-diacylglycerol--glycerol-3-phosphate 3-phosphatidyltransferase